MKKTGKGCCRRRNGDRWKQKRISAFAGLLALLPGGGMEIDMKKTKTIRRRVIAAGAFWLAGGGLLLLSRRLPAFAEWYALHPYSRLTASVGRLMGQIPFSVAELILYALIVCVLVTFVRMIVRTVRQKKAKPLADWLSGILLVAGILLFLYAVGGGINYNRTSFSEEEGFVVSEYTAEDLEEVCEWLTEQVNAASGSVERDDSGEMLAGADAAAGAVEALETLSLTYSSLEGTYPQPKGVLLSEILSYLSLTGVYSFFTIEANYNTDMTDYNIPFVMCHELSHLRGFMDEKEANFIAFLACISSDREDFVYSGYLSAWIYCTNRLNKADHEAVSALRAQLDENAKIDLAANNAYWDSFEGTAAKVSDQVNDTYLKASGQSDGVYGYDRVVDLITAYYFNNQ